jgi:hypothetical protein
VSGAIVHFGSVGVLTGPGGVATLEVPAGRGRVRIRAEHPGMTGGFPREVTVG